MDGERGSGPALRRRERRLRAWQRHVRTAVQLAFAEKLHHSANKVEPHDALRGQERRAGREEAGLETHSGLRAPTPLPPGVRPHSARHLAGSSVIGRPAARSQRNSRLLSSVLPPELRPGGEGKGGGEEREKAGGEAGGPGGVNGTRCWPSALGPSPPSRRNVSTPFWTSGRRSWTGGRGEWLPGGRGGRRGGKGRGGHAARGNLDLFLQAPGLGSLLFERDSGVVHASVLGGLKDISLFFYVIALGSRCRFSVAGGVQGTLGFIGR